MKVYDDEHVKKHLRATISHARGIPYESEDLFHDALAIMIRAGKTEEIKALKTYLDKNSGGALKRSSAPDSVLASVTAAIDMIRSTNKKNSEVTS